MTWFLEDKYASEFRLEEIVIYKRLSKVKKGKTKKQTMDVAYGLAAQDRDVERLREYLGPGKVLHTFTEIETGRKTDRDELMKAIKLTKSRPRATLVIAKLDRLARNTHFITGLMDSRVKFICADDPSANTFTIQIKAASAEEEARKCSLRTRNALAEAKKEGVKLGSAREGHWDGHEADRLRGAKKGNKSSAKVRADNARDAYAHVIDTMREMRTAGKPLLAIAAWLKERGMKTTRNNDFTATAVQRVFDLYDRAEPKTKSVA